jgi:hypothetical protein
MGMAWTLRSRAGEGEEPTLSQLVSEAEARVAVPPRHDEQAALWYCNWNDRVADWFSRSPDHAARQAFFEIEFEGPGPGTVHRKLALLRSLAG